MTTAAVAATESAPEEIAAGGETASLKGRFVLEGGPPTIEAIIPTNDKEACGLHKLVKENISVGEDGALQNVGIWLYTKVKAPEGQEPPAKVELDNQGCRFSPHVLAMQAGQTLVLKNSDPVAHNTKGSPRSNPAFNVIISPGGNQEVKTIAKAESKPFTVECSIHNWMKGYIIVTDGPYAAVSGKDGSFEIKGLPANRPLEFQVWQESTSGPLAKVNVDGKDVTWGQGRFKMTLKPGENDMGTIKAKIGGGA